MGREEDAPRQGEASRAFGDMLRERLAANRYGVPSAEDPVDRDKTEGTDEAREGDES